MVSGGSHNRLRAKSSMTKLRKCCMLAIKVGAKGRGATTQSGVGSCTWAEVGCIWLSMCSQRCSSCSCGACFVWPCPCSQLHWPAYTTSWWQLHTLTAPPASTTGSTSNAVSILNHVLITAICVCCYCTCLCCFCQIFFARRRVHRA